VALQHLGRHAESIADWEKLVKLRADAAARRRAEALNGLAYARAVAQTDLDQALREVEQALQLVGDNPAMLDTRGYIQVLRGDLEAAKTDLEVAVAGVEQQLQKATATPDYVDRREYERDLRNLKQSVAVIRYHRALLCDQLGQAEPAAADRRRVRELGFEPNDDLF
jgi:tetratricopeptide (TPR) repeat protein